MVFTLRIYDIKQFSVRYRTARHGPKLKVAFSAFFFIIVFAVF